MEHAVDFLGRGSADGVVVGQRTARVVQQFDLPAFVVGLAGGGIVAVVGHVADDAERIDAARLQPGGERRAGERAGDAFSTSRSRGRFSTSGCSSALSPRVRRPAPQPEEVLRRRPGCRRRLRRPSRGRCWAASRAHRVFDAQLAGEVLVLHVDDDQGALGGVGGLARRAFSVGLMAALWPRPALRRSDPIDIIR